MPSREAIANYPPAIADNLINVSGWQFRKDAADGAAGTATSEKTLFRVGVSTTSAVVSAVFYCPDAALTADNTNNATLIIGKRTAGGSRSTIASMQTTVANGSWVAWTPVNLGALTNAVLTAGDVLTFEITKSGSGVVVPAGTIHVVV